MNIWKLTWKNMWHRRVLTWLTIIAVAVSSTFIVFIMIIQDGVEKGAIKGYGPYELVIGADGSRTQLMLNTFYHIGAPTGNIAYDIWEKVEEIDLAEVAYPITRGDSYQGFPLIGTPAGYLVTRYPEVILTGELYEQLGEVVIGAHVAEQAQLQIGDTFHASHGMLDDDVHDELLYEVVGILPKLGTPDDKAIFTTLHHAWVVHADQGGGQTSLEDGERGDITAIVAKPKGIMELQQMQQLFDEMEGVQATYSSKTISDLLTFLDTGSALISVLSIVCVIVAAISVLLALTAVAAQRQKDIGLLRLLGKSQRYIMSSMLIEGIGVTMIGCLAGILLGHVTSFALSRQIFTYAGITIEPWSLQMAELYILFGGLFIGCIAAIVPSLQAYRVNPLVLFHS